VAADKQFQADRTQISEKSANESNSAGFGEICQKLAESVMRGLLPFLALACVAGLCGGDETVEFKPLFDGKTMEGWVVKSEKPVPEDTWSIKDGILSAKPADSWLCTKQMYADFVLRLDWRVPLNGNSGVFVRVPELKPGEHPWEKGIEIQILDDKGDQFAGKLQPYQYAGSIYGAVQPDNSMFKGAGEWNSFEITCQRELIKVVMNGQLVAQADVDELEVLKNRPKMGFIGLQNHGTAIEFRNIQIKILK
jgi:hypothetical protein